MASQMHRKGASSLPPAPPLTRVRRQAHETAALPVRPRNAQRSTTPRSVRQRVIATPAAVETAIASTRPDDDDSDTESPGGVKSVQMVNVQNVATSVNVSADPAIVSAAVQAVSAASASAEQSQRQAQHAAQVIYAHAEQTVAAAEQCFDAAASHKIRDVEAQANRHVQAQFELAEERVAQMQPMQQQQRWPRCKPRWKYYGPRRRAVPTNRILTCRLWLLRVPRLTTLGSVIIRLGTTLVTIVLVKLC
jgi:hypothetical protein